MMPAILDCGPVSCARRLSLCKQHTAQSARPRVHMGMHDGTSMQAVGRHMIKCKATVEGSSRTWISDGTESISTESTEERMSASPPLPGPAAQQLPLPTSPEGVSISFVPAGSNMRSSLPMHASSSPEQHATKKPYMLQLPDLDGVGMTSIRSWPSLSTTFEFYTLQLQPEHQGSFTELVDYVKSHLQAELAAAHPERPVYLLGEGFGAVLALAVALKCPHLVHRLLLVNPATCYPSSPLSQLGPLLARLPQPLYSASPLALAPLLVANSDPAKFTAEVLGASSSSYSSSNGNGSSIASGLFSLLSKGPTALAGDAVQTMASTLDQLQQISQHLPAAALQRRLALLAEGVRVVEPRLNTLEQRVLVLAGVRDLALPSVSEAERLVKRLQRGHVKVLPDSGHAPLSEPGVDIVGTMRSEGFLIRRRTFSSPLSSNSRRWPVGSGFGRPGPVEVPTREEGRRAGKQWTGGFRDFCSPVFFSTPPQGPVVQGLGGLPLETRPLLFVGNHQLCGQDVQVLLEEVFAETGLLMRGLAHPNLFSHLSPSGSSDNDEPQQSVEFDYQQSLANMYHTFGAVEVKPKNFYKLLQQNEAVLLYPGGLREAFKRKQEKYGLIWPKRPEFVRMASRFETTVIPVSALGLEDSLSLVMDNAEMLGSPLLGRWSQELDAAARKARIGISEDPENDHPWVPPIVAPRVPARLYFLFGQPITLTVDLYEDRDKSQQVYSQIKGQVEDGIGYLLRMREQDPYKDFLPRYLYENPLGGPKRKAPTFKV